MPILLHLTSSHLNSSLPLFTPTTIPVDSVYLKAFAAIPKSPSCSFPISLVLSTISPIRRRTHIPFCSKNDVFDEISTAQLTKTPESGGIQATEELELLGKPSPLPVNSGPVVESESEPGTPSKDEALAPFLKFFKPRDSVEQATGGGDSEDHSEEEVIHTKVPVEYYEPKAGDFVVGVVVSGNENKLDVSVGADLLGTMLTKEVLPLYDKEMEYLLCDTEKDAEDFLIRGKMGIVKNGNAIEDKETVSGRPVVELGTVLFAEVLGRTLSGRPLLSSRRLFRRIAWHRVRQIEQLSEPIEVKITEWNTGGLLTRIEGLRAFLPKTDLMGRVNNFSELKENVGRRMHVKITRINEANNDLILSEREAWESLHLQEGTLLEGTVKKIFPYGAQIRIGETNRSGLLRISNISRGRITSVENLLTVDEKVKVVVMKSIFPDRISLSTAVLESEPGLIISNKERVFTEAAQMAEKYREKLRLVSPTRDLKPLQAADLPFDDEATMYANWRWFQFEKDTASS